MRDLLNDLENGEQLSDPDPDPMKRAQKQMRQPLPRRFYKDVGVASQDDGHVVMLDGKTVKTPGRALLLLPTRMVADLVASEFSAQGEEIDPVSMPVTRLANTALDGVANDPQAVMEDILRYASSDLLCYRADAPQRLVELQAEAWDPVLDWARGSLGARLILAEGVMHVDQPREAISALGVHLSMRKEPFRLSGLHVMTSLTGSALLALAVDDGLLTVDEAWSAAHVDEDWNIAQWGEDAEAKARRASRLADMRAAAALLGALRE